jgi:hypothetical protein
MYIIQLMFAVFEVLIELTIKCSIFWDKMPCSRVKPTDVSEERIASICRVEE